MRRAARADHVISNVPTGSSKSPLCGERGRRTNRELQALAHLRVENLAAVHVEPRRERRIGQDGRSDERRVGKERVRSCSSRWSPFLYKKTLIVRACVHHTL